MTVASSLSLCCWRCGQSLALLSLPLSRMDVCPDCGIDLHVCRQCTAYDRAIARQCRNDDAEEVKEKGRRNFCDWFRPGDNAWQGAQRDDGHGRQALDRLFGDDAGAAADDDPGNPLDALFRDG